MTGMQNFLKQVRKAESSIRNFNSPLGVRSEYLLHIRGQLQNQTPIGWLKKYKIENKILLYGTVTYITALLLHIVAIHIKALVIP